TDVLPIGTVPAGDSVTVVIHARAKSSLRGGPKTGVTDTATASSTTVDPNSGNESATSGALTIDTVADSPVFVQQAVGGNGSASVEWSNVGEGNGGQTITSYTIEAC